MNQAELESRKAEIEREFKELVDKKAHITDEMSRLQGEFRLIDRILSSHVEPAPEVVEPSKRIRKVVTDAVTE